MNAVGVVLEIVEITVDSGVAKSVRPIGKKGVTRTNKRRNDEAGGNKRWSHTCGRRREIGIRSGWQEIQHEVLGR